MSIAAMILMRLVTALEQVQRHFQRLVQPAVDAVADPHAALGRLDVDVAGPSLTALKMM